jgi:hypothetical protein
MRGCLQFRDGLLKQQILAPLVAQNGSAVVVDQIKLPLFRLFDSVNVHVSLKTFRRLGMLLWFG